MNCAEIENGICTNVVECNDPNFADEMGWVPLPDGFGIGDTCIDGTWERAPQTEPPIQPPEPPPDYMAFIAGLMEGYANG